ncbi:MAG: hypothetical protein LBS47_00525 [Endomicrobium sp.]|jgi:thiamine-phosphate pyrophosphorylase|nr:hypothetical protein [Endomicrobium sp.]
MLFLSTISKKREVVSEQLETSFIKCFGLKSILRVIDANLNRCREGLRVVEDTLRFVLNDSKFYNKIRSIRHEVDLILRNNYGDLIKERDSFDDSGRLIAEVSKKCLQEILIANFKRAQESLRVLEEYSKIFISLISSDFKKQRYAVYIIEKDFFLKYKFLFKRKKRE